MRIATLQSSQSAVAGLVTRQAEQDRLQTQLSTGLRVNSPGDDPLAASQAELARSQLARVARDQRAADFSTGLMNAADDALSQGVDILQSVRESLVAAGNASYSSADKATLANSLRASRERLMSIANLRDPSGGFVFSGQGGGNSPVAGDSLPSYTPAAGEQKIGPEGRYSGSVDGRAVFFAIPRGNGVFVPSSEASNTGGASVDTGEVTDVAALTGHRYQVTITGTPGSLQYDVSDLTTQTTLASGQPYSSGQPIVMDGQKVVISGTPNSGDKFTLDPAGQQSVFATIDQAVSLLENTSVSSTQYSEKLGAIQTNLDGALDRMTLTRAKVGEAMNATDASTTMNASQKLLLEGRKSDLTDLDYAQAISAMQVNQTGLQAALRSYAAFSRLSLFDALG